MSYMYMDRLMFVRVEEKDKSEIFKNLWHSVGYYILRCKITQKKCHLQIKVPFLCIFEFSYRIFLTAFLRCRCQRYWLTPVSDENYISLINSAILIISTFGQGISFNGLKCLSFVTMYSASDATAQSTNLLSSESAGSNSK